MRYWAASGRLGTDAAYDTGQMKVGRRLAIKLLNASKFALGFGEPELEPRQGLASVITEPLDRSMIAALAHVVRDATAGFEGWDYTRPRRHRDLLLDLLRRLHRARQGPCPRR